MQVNALRLICTREAKCIKSLELVSLCSQKADLCCMTRKDAFAFIQKYSNTLFLCSELKFRHIYKKRDKLVQICTLNDCDN